METINLFENETLITEDTSETIVLTSHRVRYKDTAAGFRIVTLTLDAITSIEVRYKSYPVLLAMGIAAVIAGGYFLNEPDNTISVILFLASIGLIALFFFSRTHVVNIASPSASIQFQTKGLKKEKVIHFIDQIEKAKVKFLKI